jgi:sarcosine oxidase
LSTTLADEVANPASAKRTYDCIVLGPGAMGSACIYQLAKRGASVLGLEQFDIAHVLGSSGGISRQTKVAPYLGGPHGPLIRRAITIRSPIQPLGRKPRPKRGVSAETS